ncbi:ParA family protein [Williamsia maris]|uniref:Chromosome partitioning protein n=1 Tax=Williamsia maris TaxID=72806 RepID=A0ABT1H979_9NOCA|nr:ParA family protein [Williamsia maris]MCP2174820.1 chromosome partitioning protein [Williamsia maris]
MTSVIATISLKGGVGKTTVTAGVAEFMAGEFGRRVLVVDLDSQINLTTMFLGDERWVKLNAAGHTLATVFADAVDGTSEFSLSETLQRDVSTVSGVVGVDLIPSSLDLIEVTEELSALRVRRDDTLAGVSALRDALASVVDNYDFVLIDCPPNMGPITLNGLAMADGYIIPTIPDVLSTYGIPQVQTYIGRFGEEIGRRIVELGVVITKFKANSSVHKETVTRLRRDPSIQNVLPGYLAEANSVAAAAEFASHPSLRAKYGSRGQFDQFRELTRTIIVEADDKLAPRQLGT